MKSLAVFVVASLALGVAFAAEDKESGRLQKSAEVIREVMGAPEADLPSDLLNKAVCVGVIPSFKKVALGIGGGGGKGAIVCRRGGNGPWGGPAMFTTGGPSIGFQIGGQATDFIFLVMNASGASKLAHTNAKLGADASVAGGPKGRTASASTEATMHAEILSYSRSRGAFAGVSLEGAVIKHDHNGNERLYGRKIKPEEILMQGVNVPGEAQPLIAVLNKYSPHGGKPFKAK
jgi:lipid-binding SYLF domain-containing protein